MGNSLLHYLRFLLGLEQPQTQTTTAEQAILARWSQGVNAVVEIGVFEGFNTALLAKNMAPSGIIFGIDPFFRGRMGVSWQKLIATTYLKRQGVFGKTKIIQKFSHEALTHIHIMPDFIFIDGDHSWKGIQSDWTIFSEVLKTDGIIALHDTSVPLHEPWKASMDSVRFFREVILKDNRFEVIETVDSLNILKKCR